jgi:serine/threonine protein kinase
MKCMENHEIYHGDIKPDNFMLFDDGDDVKVPKFIDLGGIIHGCRLNSELFGNDMTLEYISHFYQRLTEIINDNDVNENREIIKNILLTNDRYAFLLMLIEQLYGLTNWFLSWYMKTIKGYIHPPTPYDFLRRPFWGEISGEILGRRQILGIMLHDPVRSAELLGEETLRNSVVQERSRLRDIPVGERKKEEVGKWTRDRVKLSGLEKKLNGYLQDQPYGLYNYFQKIFHGLNEIMDITTIEGLSARCDEWNERIWDPLWDSVMGDEAVESQANAAWVPPGEDLENYDELFDEDLISLEVDI